MFFGVILVVSVCVCVCVYMLVGVMFGHIIILGQTHVHIHVQIHTSTERERERESMTTAHLYCVSFPIQFMEREDAMNLLQCWLELDSFQQQLSTQHGLYDTQQAQTDAMVIYDK